MNTLEKRKLEGIVTSTLQDAREAYKQRRQREHSALVEKFERNIPTQVQKLAKMCAGANAEYTRKSKELDERTAEIEKQREIAETRRRDTIETAKQDAEKLGYQLSISRYDESASISLAVKTTWTGRYGNTAVRTYSEPTLTAHSKETADHVQQLDDMASEYAIAIWAEGGDMGNLLERFTKDLHAIV